MKVMKRFLSMVLVLALCLAFLPVQSVKADTDSQFNIFEFDFTSLTDKQVEEAYFGTYYNLYSECRMEITENSISYSYEDYEEYNRTIDWSYKGVVTVDNAILTFEESDNEVGTGTGKAKALKFETDTTVCYIVPKVDEDYAGDTIYLSCAEYDAKTGALVGSFVLPQRLVGLIEGWILDLEGFSEILQMVLDGKDIPRTFNYQEDDTTEDTSTEEPKTDDVTEDTSDKESTTEKTDKKVIKKTSDGRKVYEGEQVYIVKKGDSLWKIAKKLLGSGTRYNELFTRNNGIVKKARLIFVGQEIIVPVK